MVESKRDKVVQVIRNIQLKAMDEIDRICRENNINYSLSGGTCLGAVRHGGYIPWDDDIDLDMNREDFERFREVCKTELDHDKYELFCVEDNAVSDNFYSFTPQLMIKNTAFNTKSVEKSGNNRSIFIDIFLHDYVPDDPELREKFLYRIYWLKVLTYFKLYGKTIRIPKEKRGLAKKILGFTSFGLLFKLYNRYAKYYYKRGQKTNYIIDTSIIHGNYGGFPAYIKNEYTDIDFEGHTYRIIKEYDTYLKILYGENYMDIFPPEKRISHHKWKRIDLGPYAKEYGLPDGYEKYLLMELEEKRAKHVKKLSMDMIDEIGRICDKNGLSYYLAGEDLLYYVKNIPEYGKMWRDDVTVLLTAKDYLDFRQACQDELDEKYVLEDESTCEDYHFPYGKLKLNYTNFRDRRIFPAEVNQGLWINIGILIPTSDNEQERLEHYRDLNTLYRLIRYKWLFDSERGQNLKLKGKKNYSEWKSVQHVELEELILDRNDIINKYEDKVDSKYVLESTTSLLKTKDLLREELGKGTKVEYLGYQVSIPDSLKEVATKMEESQPALRKKLNKIIRLRVDDSAAYDNMCENFSEKEKEALNNKVSYFELGMYDQEDYRSSVFDMEL